MPVLIEMVRFLTVVMVIVLMFFLKLKNYNDSLKTTLTDRRFKTKLKTINLGAWREKSRVCVCVLAWKIF